MALIIIQIIHNIHGSQHCITNDRVVTLSNTKIAIAASKRDNNQLTHGYSDCKALKAEADAHRRGCRTTRDISKIRTTTELSCSSKIPNGGSEIRRKQSKGCSRIQKYSWRLGAGKCCGISSTICSSDAQNIDPESEGTI